MASYPHHDHVQGGEDTGDKQHHSRDQEHPGPHMYDDDDDDDDDRDCDIMFHLQDLELGSTDFCDTERLLLLLLCRLCSCWFCRSCGDW